LFLYGSATADDENIAAGTTVYAVMDSVVVAIGAVDPNEDPLDPGTFLGGTYGQEASFRIQATSDEAGHPVTFYIGGTPSLGQAPAQAGGELATTDPAVVLFQQATLQVNLMLGEPPVEHTLLTSSTTCGNVTAPGDGNNGNNSYPVGTVVPLVATPDAGCCFTGWTGNGTSAMADPTAASTTITMDADYTVVANFAPGVTLTTSAGTGGTVTTPATSPTQHCVGAVVPIEATPDSGFMFVIWSGQTGTITNVNAASTTILMDADYGIMANFDVVTSEIEVTTVRSSSVRSTTVTLWGNLGSLGDYSPVDVSFEWGTTSGALDQETTPQARTTAGNFIQVVGGLTPQTTYYFRAKAAAGAEGDYGDVMSFTTTVTPTPKPPAPQPTAEPTAQPTPEPTAEPSPSPTPTEAPTPPPIPTEEEVELPVDEGGEVQGDVSHSAFDGTIVVDIGDGTVAQTAGGDALPEITIREAALVYPSPNAGDCIVPPAYEFLPTGATFDPAITITLHYDEGQLAALCPGVAEGNLGLAQFAEGAVSWQVLPSTVNTVNNVITAEVSGFSYIAVYAEGPEATPTAPPTEPPPGPVVILGGGGLSTVSVVSLITSISSAVAYLSSLLNRRRQRRTEERRSELEAKRHELEIQKLELEIKRLQDESEEDQSGEDGD
jgi:hypothetical protein